MATKHHTDFERLLRILFRKQQQMWASEGSHSPNAWKTREFLENRCGTWSFISDEKQFDKMPWQDDSGIVRFQNHAYVMPLPPLEKNADFVPIMSVEYHPSASFHEACLRIRVLMIRQIEDGLVGFGFRIESPEHHCNEDEEFEGMHDFYHAQLIKGIGYGPDIKMPDWLPCTQPSFPLWAVDPIDAMLNLVLTLYGRKYYKEFWVSISPPIGVSEEFRHLNERFNAR